MNTRDIGKFGELVAMKELSKIGYDILLPTSDHLPFDFVAYKNSMLFKIQVKTRSKTNGVLSFKLSKNPYPRYNETVQGRKYSEQDFDWLLLVDIETESVYKFTWEDLIDKESINLRIEKTKNNQTKGVWIAENYALVA